MILTLCGSTKFMDLFYEANRKFTLQGHVVLTVCMSSHTGVHKDCEPTPREKKILDEVHKKKIDISDAIVVLNANDYIGSSTYDEILYAHRANKPIYLYYFHNSLGQYDGLRELVKARRIPCPYPGCYDSFRQPPCPLCYE